MYSSRQSIMPLGRGGLDDAGAPYSVEHAKSATSIMKTMSKAAMMGYRAANSLRSEAIKIDRLNTILDCTEYAVLVRQDATRSHQEALKAEIEPQVQQLLKLREERRAERDKQEERYKRRASNIQSGSTPKSEVAAVRREQLLLQRRDRLKKENLDLERQLAEQRRA